MDLWLRTWSALLWCLWLSHVSQAGDAAADPTDGAAGPEARRDPIAEERHRILVVKKGRMAYLNPRVLLENPPSEGTCLVQVVNNDYMTQRVGKLTPQVRDVFFPFSVRLK